VVSITEYEHDLSKDDLQESYNVFGEPTRANILLDPCEFDHTTLSDDFSESRQHDTCNPTSSGIDFVRRPLKPPFRVLLAVHVKEGSTYFRNCHNLWLNRALQGLIKINFSIILNQPY
jgi:hypothetical protein